MSSVGPGVDWDSPDGDLSPDEIADLRRRLASAVAWICPEWLTAQMEDIVQNCMVQLLRSRNKGEGKQEYPSTYLQRVAHGATVDEIRRHSRWKENLVGTAGTLDGPAPSGITAPDSAAFSAEVGKAIRGCLVKLVRSRQLAVALYLQGCTVREVAGLLGWSAKRADNLVYRGLSDLRRCLTRKGITP